MSIFPYTIGIYEKALPGSFSWQERFAAVRKAGFDFIEMSIDESDWRLGRLDWSSKKRSALKNKIDDSEIQILSMCLSAHRRYPLGSKDPISRKRSLEILKKAIDFAVDTGIKIILVPGYDVFYEESTPASKERFLSGLQQAAAMAGQAKIMLALENTDKYITSIKQARDIVDQLDSEWLQLYGDIGNLVAAGHNLFDELEIGACMFAGIHLKDAQPGIVRKVPLGQGIVPFVPMFQKLQEINFNGPLMLELWEDSPQDPIRGITESLRWIQDKHESSLLPIIK